MKVINKTLKNCSSLPALMTVAVFALVLGCTSGPPKITESFIAQVSRFDPRSNVSVQSLGVFATIEDLDGLADIDRIWIISDQGQSLWELNPGNWEILTINNRAWVGSSLLGMPVDEDLPKGNLRIQVEDRGGNRTETSLGLGSAATVMPVGRLSLNGGTITIVAEEKARVEISVRDWSENELLKMEASSRTVPLTSLARGRAIGDLRFYLYCFNEGLSNISVSGPWTFADK